MTRSDRAMWLIGLSTLAISLSALIIVSCEADPVSRSSTNNADITVDTLFTHDGCTGYRFYDGTNRSPRYYVRCKDSVSTQWIENCGKNCTRDMQVPTLRAGDAQ